MLDGGLCFFFKQKTAYEMRISDWSSDVCSSDLRALEILVNADVGLGPDVRQARRSGQPRPDGPRDRQNRTVHLQPVLLDTRGEGEDKAVGIFPVFMHVAQGDVAHQNGAVKKPGRSEEHTSELPSLMRISYAVFCLHKKKHNT